LKILRFAALFTFFCVSYTIEILPTRAQDAQSVDTTPPTSVVPTISTTPPTGDAPLVITAGHNSFIGKIAMADDNVVVRYKDDVVFADHVIYDRAIKVVTATGNVRIFSGKHVYRGDSITYNFDTKAITSSSFFGQEYPKFIQGKQVTTPEFSHYRLTNASFTTNNRQNPSFHLEATTVEYRPNDEVVLKNVLLYIGNVPVLYFPIFVQSLTDSRPAYQFELGNSGRFGAFIDNRYNWESGGNLLGTVEFDARSKRGFAGGVDVQYYPSATSDILLRTYFAKDNLYSQKDPNYPDSRAHGDIGDPNVYDGVASDSRYRVSYQQHLQFGPELSSTADLNFWSDPWVTRDYFSSEYQQENQPANFVNLVDYNPDFTISLLAAPQVNPFFQTIERLPEFTIESKQQKIFGSPIEYASTSSLVNFQMHYADTNNFRDPSQYIYNSFPQTTAYTFYHPNPNFTFDTNQQNNYSAYRYDTYHEFYYPHQYFDFLSLTPRIGGRLTYYSDDNQDINDTTNNTGLSSDKITNPKARLAGDVGLEGDFKISRTWTDVSIPNLGINGIRHVIEPFFDAHFAPTPTVTPNTIRGFDNQLYSTQLQPLDWLSYNSIDSLDKQEVVRFGTWNRIQTKRDGANYDLLDWETYADADFAHNFSSATPNSTMSNLFNDIYYHITPQFTVHSFSSVDMGRNGYNEIDNDITWSPDPSLRFGIGDHYINHSPVFANSNAVALDLFYRINEHWQFESQQQFEAQTGRLQLQQYTLYRDLDSWQLAMTYASSEISNGHNDQSIFFSLTLKAFPQYKLSTPHL
jgi:LPS-assembly protein